MSLILSGTDGLSDVDGSAATPAIRGTDANTGIFFGTDIIGFSEGGAEAARIDASGNFCLGTAAVLTSGKLSLQADLSAVNAMTLRDSGTTYGVSSYYTLYQNSAGNTVGGIGHTAVTSLGINATTDLQFFTAATERARIDSSGNVQMQTGAVMPYAPAHASVSAAETLTNAKIQAQIINTTGTTYTVTMPLGTTLETLATWATTGIGYDFYVINTASGTVTMAVNTGVTSLGTLTIATGVSAQFRIRRTAANTFVLYRLG